MSYIGYYMFSLLQAIQGRWFSICLDDVLHVEYSRPHKLRRPIVVEATWRPPAKSNPAYAKPIPAWPPAKAMPKVIPAKIGIPIGAHIPAKIGSIAAYAGQPRCWPPKARPLLKKLGGPPKPKPKRLPSTPKQGWTKRNISLKTARGTVVRQPPDEEMVSPEEWLKAKQECVDSGWMDVVEGAEWMEHNMDVQWDARVGTPVEDD